MMVLSLTACPTGLRGDLSKWLMEISPGTFVGRPSARIRDALWERTVMMSKRGSAIMVFHAANEQGFDFKVHNHFWETADYDGLTLIRKPTRKK